ncbi:MAG TPA: hypothetical protein VFU48_14740 [Nitrospira sp.]|nr:hypothetical protein [Nitrospira sp.]
MHKGEENNLTQCLECELPTQERLNFFTGQFLAERDFRTEQIYHIGKHRQHNRYLHGWGTVCGLSVVQHPQPECRDRFVIIEPGLALDCCGREIVVQERVYVDLQKYLAPTNGTSTAQGKHLLISLCYTECKTELVPALYSECGCDETRCEANRVRESFEMRVQRMDQLPEPLPHEPVGIHLNWTTTINLERASRLALDTTGKRIYVLNSADAGQIMVYDTDHNCLLRTIDIQGRGVDLAISPTGQFLYVIRHVAGTPGDYFLRVIGVQDLDNPTIVNDLQLASGSVDPSPPVLPLHSPKVAVAIADGRVYTLDPNAAPDKKVIIWTTGINIPGANPTTSTFAELKTGSDPRDIAVSADGVWLFIAEGAADKHVKAVKVQTLTGGSPVIHIIAVPDTPTLLAISNDSQRLYTSTGAKKIRAFQVQEAPTSFPEMGSGIDIGPDEPIAVQTSPSGKWAYVLVRDASGKGWVRVVNGENFETDPSHALTDPVAVVAAPQDVLLSPEGRRLYAAGEAASPQCGGVSVLDVSEASCAEIFWRALEGCPECPEDLCVPLAAVHDHKEGQAISDKEIDNLIRPLVPSTETLRQVILCALESGTGKQGPEGPQGNPGAPGADGAKWFDGNGAPSAGIGTDGDYYLDSSTGDVFRKISGSWAKEGNIKGPKGDPGSGLEADLTQIVALSWKHNSPSSVVPILNSNREDIGRRGIVIGFSKPVVIPTQIDRTGAEHVFEVLIEHDPLLNPESQLRRLGVVCRCALVGRVISVRPRIQNGIITEAVEANAPERGLAFIFDRETRIGNHVVENGDVELWVRLRGDFVLDWRGDNVPGKAIDAEFVRAELPTGDRPSGSKFGIQGGLFESWFRIRQG